MNKPKPSVPTLDNWVPQKFHIPVLLGALFLLLLPFLNKAFHIDDLFWIYTSNQILKDAFDFYGYRQNWFGVESWMYEITKTPPLFSYLLTPIIKFFGSGEVVLHLAALLPVFFTAAGIYFFSKEFCDQPLTATVLSISTPLFLVSSNLIMCDMLLAGFWVWSFLFWVKGVENQNNTHLFMGAVLAGFSALTKFNGASVIPLLVLYSVIKEKRAPLNLLFLLIPLLFLAAYQILTAKLYGQGLLLDAASYSINYEPRDLSSLFSKTITTFSFIGGCLATLVFF